MYDNVIEETSVRRTKCVEMAVAFRRRVIDANTEVPRLEQRRRGTWKHSGNFSKTTKSCQLCGRNITAIFFRNLLQENVESDNFHSIQRYRRITVTQTAPFQTINLTIDLVVSMELIKQVAFSAK